MSWPQRRSRNGWSATAVSTLGTSASARPVARPASTSSSAAVRRRDAKPGRLRGAPADVGKPVVRVAPPLRQRGVQRGGRRGRVAGTQELAHPGGPAFEAFRVERAGVDRRAGSPGPTVSITVVRRRQAGGRAPALAAAGRCRRGSSVRPCAVRARPTRRRPGRRPTRHSPAPARSAASTSCSFGPPTETGRPSRSTTNGPSTRNDRPAASAPAGTGSSDTSCTTTGRGRPFSSTVRASPNTQSDRFADTDRTVSEHRIVPGSATAHSRAASTTAVPWRSAPSTIASPTLTPTRNATPSPVSRLWAAIAPWMSGRTAQRRHRRRECRHHPVPGRLHGGPAVLGHRARRLAGRGRPGRGRTPSRPPGPSSPSNGPCP